MCAEDPLVDTAEHPKAFPVFYVLASLMLLLLIVWWVSSKARGF